MQLIVILSCAIAAACSHVVPIEVRVVSQLKCNYTSLVGRALSAWTFPGISVRYSVVNSLSNSTSDAALDGTVEFVFGPFATPGHTRRYYTEEVDVAIHADSFPDCKTLYATILHEMGHLLGLNHPFIRQDSVMGLHLQLRSESSVFEKIPYWVKPTRDDIIAIFMYEKFQHYAADVDYEAYKELALEWAPSVLSELLICL